MQIEDAFVPSSCELRAASPAGVVLVDYKVQPGQPFCLLLVGIIFIMIRRDGALHRQKGAEFTARFPFLHNIKRWGGDTVNVARSATDSRLPLNRLVSLQGQLPDPCIILHSSTVPKDESAKPLTFA